MAKNSSSGVDKCPKVWEKARRDKMKSLFDELSRLLPHHDPAAQTSRTDIINKAMTHIRDLQAQNEDLLKGGFNEIYKNKIDTWKQRVKELLGRVDQLTKILRVAKIHVPPIAVDSGWIDKRPKNWSNKISFTPSQVETILQSLNERKKRKKNQTESPPSTIGKKKKMTINSPSSEVHDNQSLKAKVVRQAIVRPLSKVEPFRATPRTDDTPTSVSSTTAQGLTSSEAPRSTVTEVFTSTAAGTLTMPVISEAQNQNIAVTTSGNTSSVSPATTITTSVTTTTNHNRLLQLPRLTPVTIAPQPLNVTAPVTIQSIIAPQQTGIAAQANTYILTNQGNLLPVLQPAANVLTPVIINRPSPMLFFQSPPVQTNKHIIAKPPANKRKIPRETTVLTFTNNKPIPAPSKQINPKRSGKGKIGKTANKNLNATTSAPAMSPTAAFLRSFPLVKNTKSVGTGPDDSSMTQKNEDCTQIIEANASERSEPVAPVENNNSSPEKIDKASQASDCQVPDESEITPSKENENAPSIIGNESVASTLTTCETAERIATYCDEAIKPSSAMVSTAVKEKKIATKFIVSDASTVSSVTDDLPSIKAFQNTIIASSSSSSVVPAKQVQKNLLETEHVAKDSNENPDATTIETASTETFPANNSSTIQKNGNDDSNQKGSKSTENSASEKIGCVKRTPLVNNSYPANSKLPEDAGNEKNSKQTDHKTPFAYKKPIANESDTKCTAPTSVNANLPFYMNPESKANVYSSQSRHCISTASFSSTWSSISSLTTPSPMTSNPSWYPNSTALTSLPPQYIPPATETDNRFLTPLRSMNNTAIPPITSSVTSTIPSTSWRPMSSDPLWTTIGQSSSCSASDNWSFNMIPKEAPSQYVPPTFLDQQAQSGKAAVHATSSSATSAINSSSTASLRINNRSGRGVENTHFSNLSTKVMQNTSTVTNNDWLASRDKPAVSISNNNYPVNSTVPPYVGIGSKMESSDSKIQHLPQNSYNHKQTGMDNMPNKTHCIQSNIMPYKSSMSSAQSTGSSYSNIPTLTTIGNSNVPSNAFKYMTASESVKPQITVQSSTMPKYHIQPLGSSSRSNVPSCIESTSLNSSVESRLYQSNGSTAYLHTPTTQHDIATAHSKGPYDAFLAQKQANNASKSIANATLSSFPTNINETTYFPSYSSNATTSILSNEPVYTTLLTASNSSFPSNLFHPTRGSNDSTNKSSQSTSSNNVAKCPDIFPVVSSEKQYHSFMSQDQKPIIGSNHMEIPYSTSTASVKTLCSTSVVPNKGVPLEESPPNLWNGPYVPHMQTATTVSQGEASGPWGHLDVANIASSEIKDNRIKPLFNWMTEPEPRLDPALTGHDDHFSNKYQTVERKDSQAGQNMFDFCLNTSNDDDASKGKHRKKDADSGNPDYFSWLSMKVDPFVVPSTLPTLVGDLALGGEPTPAKRSKTTSANVDNFKTAKSAKEGDTSALLSQDLSKNIFDFTQNESFKTGNNSETIVLKNIFELPTPTPSSKPKTNPGQNTFLSVSQLVEPTNMEGSQGKSDFPYYNQRTVKNKRGSGWKCTEKKCLQPDKTCSNYSAESLLKTALPQETNATDQEFTIVNPAPYPLDFPTDSIPIESTDVQLGQPLKHKACARPRKQDCWNIPNSSTSFNFTPTTTSHISNMKQMPGTQPNDPPPLPLSYFPDPRLPAPKPPNIHLAPCVPTSIPFPRFPSNPLLTGPNFQQAKAVNEPFGGIFPGQRPVNPPDSAFASSNARYPGPRKNFNYPRTGKVSFPPFSPAASSESSHKPASRQIPHIQHVSNTTFPASLQAATGRPYPTFPAIPTQPAGPSGSSLANFNLTTIFPEMNKKGYPYP